MAFLEHLEKSNMIQRVYNRVFNSRDSYVMATRSVQSFSYLGRGWNVLTDRWVYKLRLILSRVKHVCGRQ